MPTKKNPAPSPEVEPSDAPASEFGSFEAYGQTFRVLKAPPLLLVAELGRTDSGSPESVGVIADLFEQTLGREQYVKFRTASYAAPDDSEMTECIGRVLEALVPATPTA